MRVAGSALLLLGLCLGPAPTLRATTVFSGAGGKGTIGNSLSFNGSDFLITASAWSLSNLDTSTTFAQAALGQWSAGLAVCDSGEFASCSSPNHAVDNSGYKDFVLLQTNRALSSIQLVLSPFGQGRDTDITYFVGNCTGTCSPLGMTAANLQTLFTPGHFIGPVNSFDGSGANSATGTVNLNLGVTGSSVNWILISATTASYLGDSRYSQYNDYFKINGVGTPEPATFGLAGAALLAMGLLGVRKKRSSTS
ncbi:MAG: hypothetical protein LAO55_15060 [Acidobacteriia bacterium]|nr:hypothetical protein [Terriglobia bacterium]